MENRSWVKNTIGFILSFVVNPPPPPQNPLESTSEDLINFLGEHALQTPLEWHALHARLSACYMFWVAALQPPPPQTKILYQSLTLAYQNNKLP